MRKILFSFLILNLAFAFILSYTYAQAKEEKRTDEPYYTKNTSDLNIEPPGGGWTKMTDSLVIKKDSAIWFGLDNTHFPDQFKHFWLRLKSNTDTLMYILYCPPLMTGLS